MRCVFYMGCSGLALENLKLNPLGLDRTETWLCDLVPHSCIHPSQSKAVEREYLSIASHYGLPTPSGPHLPKPVVDESRRNRIMKEIPDSKARILILLGDMPVRWFLSFFDSRLSKLTDYGHDQRSYGKLHDTNLAGEKMRILPIAHPRQIAKLWQSSAIWHNAHTTLDRTSSQRNILINKKLKRDFLTLIRQWRIIFSGISNSSFIKKSSIFTRQ